MKLSVPAFTFSTARSTVFTLEYYLLNALQLMLPGGRELLRAIDPQKALEIRKEMQLLLKRDAENIEKGIYPIDVLRPESPLEHVKRLPLIMLDGISIYRRRRRGKTAEFDREAREYLSELPRYYRRNFHFQTDGYLSMRSASLYEHEVEMLFGGTADAMRRLILAPLRERFGKGDGHGLTFLEIGAGTGRATRFVRHAFPRAKIVAVDLSDPYLKQAEKSLTRFPRIDFVQADGAKLPFREETFDAAYSIFLYHELPLAERQAVLSESKRVLKKGGFIGLVDSLQLGDKPSFDELLKGFPERYHEPFYRNYIANPMQKLLEEQGCSNVMQDQGFFSKVCSATV